MISATTFAADGIVLSIDYDDAFVPFLDCGAWSDFSNEREYLFIGGLQPLFVKSVRDIPTNTNYGNYVETISMFTSMIRGTPTTLRAPIKRDVKYLYSLLSDVIHINKYLEFRSDLNSLGLEKYLHKKKPIFITNLFKHFIINVKKIEINLLHMNVVDKFKQWNMYGFKIFLPLIFNASTQTRPSMTLFISLFSKCGRVILYDIHNRDEYKSTITLDDEFTTDVLRAIQFIQERNTRSPLKYIAITEPKDSIPDFINNHSDKFNALNWRLYHESWTDNAYLGQCENCLYIVPRSIVLAFLV